MTRGRGGSHAHVRTGLDITRGRGGSHARIRTGLDITQGRGGIHAHFRTGLDMIQGRGGSHARILTGLGITRGRGGSHARIDVAPLPRVVRVLAVRDDMLRAQRQLRESRIEVEVPPRGRVCDGVTGRWDARPASGRCSCRCCCCFCCCCCCCCVGVGALCEAAHRRAPVLVTNWRTPCTDETVRYKGCCT